MATPPVARIRPVTLSLICAAVGVSGVHAQVSWGSDLFSDFRDSRGNPLDESFQIQLGFFESVPGERFTPSSDNVTEWIQQWRVFDQAPLNLGLIYFTSEARVNTDGTGSSSFADLGINFEGQEAYMWVRNGVDLVPGTEWFLATAPEWVFPEGSDECCDPSLPLQWSINDLKPQVGSPVRPVWGGQSGENGSGTFTTTSPDYTMQTFTFVPEPSTLLLTMAGSCLLLIRKRTTA